MLFKELIDFFLIKAHFKKISHKCKLKNVKKQHVNIYFFLGGGGYNNNLFALTYYFGVSICINKFKTYL